jgi:hypothetical protein
MRIENRNTHSSARINRLTEEIYRLAEEQTKALKRATFLGMTTHEAKECDSRRGRIRRLIGEIEQLQNTKASTE